MNDYSLRANLIPILIYNHKILILKYTDIIYCMK